MESTSDTTTNEIDYSTKGTGLASLTYEEMTVTAHQLAFYADSVAGSLRNGVGTDKQKLLSELQRIVQLAGVLSKALT